MDTLPNIMSSDGQHALQDMVDFEMYLVAQSRQTKWSLFPRGAKGRYEDNRPYSNLVDSDVARELIDRGFLEATSNLTFVVSKSGYQLYGREMKPLGSERQLMARRRRAGRQPTQ